MRFKSLLFTFVFMTLPMSFCTAATEKAANEIYNFEDISFKFIPPENWQPAGNPGMWRFSPSGDMVGSMVGLSVTIFPKNHLGSEPFIEEFLKGLLTAAQKDSDYKIVSHEFASFAGTKALVLVTESAFETPIKIKNKTVTFAKGDRQFQIQFTSEKEKFDAFLPVVNEALKTFEITSRDLNATQPDLKGMSSNYALDLRNQFKAILEKMYLEIFTVAGQNKDEWLLNSTPGGSLQEKSKNAAAYLLLKYKAVVDVPEAEAKAILSGKLDDSKNLAAIKRCVAEFMHLRMPIPTLIQYLLGQYQRHALSSLELELTARVFKEQLDQMTAVRNKT